MPRTDNDTWDLASSVGATATMVAAARAVASRADQPVIDDPFAAPLVRAVGIDFFTRLATGELDDIHRRHGEARAVDHAADIAIQGYVVEIPLRGPRFAFIFLAGIVHLL